MAGAKPGDIGHVNAHGLSTELDDCIEAEAIRRTLGDVPVTAPKSFFGNIGAGGGAVELAVSLLGLQRSLVPPTLNYDEPDPSCPINVVAEMSRSQKPTSLNLSHRTTGQAVALLVAVE
jgi:3-oxoacyl-[acyl-carrier-protein] synthase II